MNKAYTVIGAFASLAMPFLLGFYQVYMAWLNARSGSEFASSPQLYASVSSVYVMTSGIWGIGGMAIIFLTGRLVEQELRIRRLERQVAQDRPADAPTPPPGA